ncbi:Uncharacterized protein Adt_23828 [Abeliophyllum distichum]|uniref:Uncharacterized protein n=1 Tax=Abeliophyllum distichum TaxID=126358 RepID=A0ABD1SER6_9LAMI
MFDRLRVESSIAPSRPAHSRRSEDSEVRTGKAKRAKYGPAEPEEVKERPECYEDDDDENLSFTNKLKAMELLVNFRMPIMDRYNGRGDPSDHISIYKTKLQGQSPAVNCQNFHTTLISDAKRTRVHNTKDCPDVRKLINCGAYGQGEEDRPARRRRGSPVQGRRPRRNGGRNDRNRDPPRLNRPAEAPPVREINTIIGGPYVGEHTVNSRQNYAKAAREEPVESWQVHGHRPKAPLISFTEEDEAGIHYPYCDALVVRAIIARNGLGRMLVDDGSAVNILFGSAFDQMEVDHEVTAISEPLFGFTGDSLIPRRRINLAVDFGEPPRHIRKFMKFLIVDTHSANHGILGRPALKYLQAVTSIHHLAMKFPTPGGVAKVHRNQTEAQACYMNALQKVAKHEDVAPAVMTIHSEPMDLDNRELDEEMILDERLDLRIIVSDSLASLTEELEAFPVNPSEPT